MASTSKSTTSHPPAGSPSPRASKAAFTLSIAPRKKEFTVLSVKVVKVRDGPKGKMKKMDLAGLVSISPPLELHDFATGGIPTTMLATFMRSMHILTESDVLRAVGISHRTIQRRQEGKLDPDSSAAAIDFAAVLQKATEVLGSNDLAEQWMIDPAIALGGRKPIDLIATRQGAQMVKDHLTRMDYGVYA